LVLFVLKSLKYPRFKLWTVSKIIAKEVLTSLIIILTMERLSSELRSKGEEGEL